MAIAAYRATISSGGTAVAMTNEAMTRAANGDFQVTNVNKRVLDLNGNFQVKVNGVAVNEASYEIDYIAGKVIGLTTSSAVTITGAYVPIGELIGCNSFSVDISGDILENTGINEAQLNGGFRTKQYGLTDVAVSLGRFADASKTMQTRLQSGNKVFLKINPSDTERILGWFLIESVSQSGDVGSLEIQDIQLQLSGDIRFSFSWP
jgi:hypothetical protein